MFHTRNICILPMTEVYRKRLMTILNHQTTKKMTINHIIFVFSFRSLKQLARYAIHKKQTIVKRPSSMPCFFQFCLYSKTYNCEFIIFIMHITNRISIFFVLLLILVVGAGAQIFNDEMGRC